MKKLATFVLAGAVLAAAAGCTAPAGPASPESPTSAPPTSPYFGSAATDGPTPNKTLWDYQTPVMTDKAFYAEARKGTTTLDDIDDDKLTIMSQVTCASLGNGESSKDVLLKQAIRTATGTEDGLTAAASADLKSLLVAGTKNYCSALEPALAAAIG